MTHRGDELILALRERGERLTPQRLLTLEIIQKNAGHLTAEAIYQEAQKQQPYLSIATIYRTLQWLQDQGLVSVLNVGSDHRYYEYHGGTPHHHLICSGCQAVVQLDDAVFDQLKDQLLGQYGFHVQTNHLALTGLCAHCAAS